MTNDPQSLFDSLVRERGGTARFDQTQLHIARRLAVMLTDDAEISPPAISQLLSLLPEKTAEPPYDLTLLTDRQLDQLERLCAIAAGKKPETPRKPKVSTTLGTTA